MDFVNCFVKSIVSKGKDVLDSVVYIQTRIEKKLGDFSITRIGARHMQEVKVE